MSKNTVLYTEYTFCEKGELFNATLQKKGKTGIIPLKNGLDTEKYGGYISPNTSYFAQIEYDGKKGERVKNIIGVPIYIANMLDHDPEAFVDYCEQTKGFSNVKTLVPCIKKNSLLVINGFPMRIRGENERDSKFKSNLQLIIDQRNEETIRKVEKWAEKKPLSIDEKYDHISDTDAIALYDCYCEKLGSGKFKNRPANQLEKMIENRDIFVNLDLYEKVRVLNSIQNMFRCDTATTADLSLIGGGPNAGNIAVNKNTLGKSKVVWINQSVTGLYENSIEL